MSGAFQILRSNDLLGRPDDYPETIAARTNALTAAQLDAAAKEGASRPLVHLSVRRGFLMERIGAASGQAGWLQRFDAVIPRSKTITQLDEPAVDCAHPARCCGVAVGEFDHHIAADIVVSNADTAWTYKNLVAPQHRRYWTNRKIENGRYSMGLFVWYFGTNRQYHDVPHHMILLGKRYRELLTDIFKRKVLAEDFSLYLHRPTATDPSLAPDGHDTFYVLAPVPNLDSGTNWQEQAEPYRQAIAQYLDQSVLPGLQDHVTTSFLMTPQDFQDRLLSVKGAAFGFEPLLLQSAWFRPHNRSEDVKGLYMVGAGTHPGAGIPGVLSSAKALMSVVPHPVNVATGYAK